jgi:hypothetical protein
VLALASAFEVLGRELPEPLRRAARAAGEEARALDLFVAEAELLDSLAALPLYRRSFALIVRPGLIDVAAGAAGLARFEDAWRWPPAER